MGERVGIIDWYTAQLQEIGYPEEEAIEFGQILYAGAERFSEMFGMDPETYLERRLAGYSGMTQAQFLKMFDTFFKYETLEPEVLQDREYLRKDFVRKSDNATIEVVKFDSHLAPIGSAKQTTEWAMKVLNEQGGNIEIASTGQIVEFVKKRVHDCVVKRCNPNRKGSDLHREAFVALRDMIAKAEYWKSRNVDERHKTQGDQDIYNSALYLNGTLYSVIIKLDTHAEKTKELAKKHNENLEDYYYKDHSLIEIEIAPALSETSCAHKSGGIQPMAKATGTEAISRISLGILRDRVKPSLIEKDILYNVGKLGEMKGAMRTLLDGRRVIALFENHDPSTILHEMAHFWLEELREAQNSPSCPDWATELWADLEYAYGFNKETLSKHQWVVIQERFALEFERYCKAGEVPNQALQPVFEKFKEWVSDICDLFMNNGKNDKIRSVSKRIFDAILGGEEDEPEEIAYRPM